MIAFGASPCALIPKIIPELSAGRHLLVKFPSRSGFIAVFLLEALDNTTMLFSLILSLISLWRKCKGFLVLSGPWLS